MPTVTFWYRRTADVANRGVPGQNVQFPKDHTHQGPGERRHHHRQGLPDVDAGPDVVTRQAVVVLAADGVKAQKRRDGPGLKQAEFLPGNGPLDVLMAAKVPLQAFGQLEDPAGKPLQLGWPLVAAPGP
jgi:hypothetical protein